MFCPGHLVKIRILRRSRKFDFPNHCEVTAELRFTSSSFQSSNRVNCTELLIFDAKRNGKPNEFSVKIYNI